jgi:hypothetical protein
MLNPFLLFVLSIVFKFFSKKKLDNILSGEEIFNQITGMSFEGEGETFLGQVKYITFKKIVSLLFS